MLIFGEREAKRRPRKLSWNRETKRARKERPGGGGPRRLVAESVLNARDT